MTSPTGRELDNLWARHNAEWRDTAQIASQWAEARKIDPDLLRYRARGAWWDTLEAARITLLVTREYEHLVMAINVTHGKPVVTFIPLPHPSGVVVDRKKNIVTIASTRNPNQIYDFEPVAGLVPRRDTPPMSIEGRPLVPVKSRFYPGCTYLHDLTLVNGQLHGNAVGHNAVVRLDPDGRMTRVWWPRCIEGPQGPLFEQNYIQLNSIAAGNDLSTSYFTASADEISSRRPGHRNFPTDGRGVIFDGTTREPMVRGLTRPHSARLHQKKLWVANSGYGELGFVNKGELETVVELPGWTRGLTFRGRIGFVGTSRVIPRFRQYAPGLDVDRSQCGVHAVDISTGRLLGSLIWPYGNQIFGVDWAPRGRISGFPFSASRRGSAPRAKKLFYAYTTGSSRSGRSPQ
jgi:uncharacterized protein (TIGR03032 family)